MNERVMVTEAARDLIVRLKARYGSGDLLLGAIEGCPFYIDREQYERWRRPAFLIDVSPGDGDTFSLEGPEGMHFVARAGRK